MASLRIGTVCKFGTKKDRFYGLEVPLATFPKTSDDNRLRLTKWLLKALRQKERNEGRKPKLTKLRTLQNIERQILPMLPELTRGGRVVNLKEHDDTPLTRDPQT